MMFKFIHNKKTTDDISPNNIDIHELSKLEIPINDLESPVINTTSLIIDKTLTNSVTSEYLFNETRTRIKEKLNKTIEHDISDTIRWRYIWRKSGNAMEGLSLITSLVSTVLSFSAGAFNHTSLAFAAGCLGSISLALMRATSYSMKESKEREEQLNILLEKARIKRVPSLVIDEGG